MKKKVILIIIAALIIIGGITTYFILTSKPQDQEATNKTSTTEDKTQDNGEAGNYANYDPKAVAAREDKIVLFFHAAWNPTALKMEKSILESTIPKNVTIFKVNYDLETDLRDKYAVSQTPTFIEIDDQGNEKNRLNATESPDFQSITKALSL